MRKVDKQDLTTLFIQGFLPQWLRMSFEMNRSERMERLLRDSLGIVELNIIDESHKHAGHSGARPEGETHYRIIINALELKGKTRLEQHRLLNALLNDEFDKGMHALALEIKS